MGTMPSLAEEGASDWQEVVHEETGQTYVPGICYQCNKRHNVVPAVIAVCRVGRGGGGGTTCVHASGMTALEPCAATLFAQCGGVGGFGLAPWLSLSLCLSGLSSALSLWQQVICPSQLRS